MNMFFWRFPKAYVSLKIGIKIAHFSCITVGPYRVKYVSGLESYKHYYIRAWFTNRCHSYLDLRNL